MLRNRDPLIAFLNQHGNSALHLYCEKQCVSSDVFEAYHSHELNYRSLEAAGINSFLARNKVLASLCIVNVPVI